MAVITISRQFGAGGITLGQQLAKKLGYGFIYEEIIEKVAEKAAVSKDWVKSLDKDGGGTVSNFMAGFVPSRLIDHIFDTQRQYMDEKTYIKLLYQIVPQIAQRDNLVIIGRGAQFILKDYPNTHHVLLIADLAHRINFMMRRYQLSEDAARKAVTKEDVRRRKLLRLFKAVDYDRPEHYDLVLNMGKINIDLAQELVCDLLVA
ncbi:MAG: cytidylate kinase-like family protein [Desulfobacterales bacterium]|jgi:cytidylate kinase|nr:cytidylate kinase-like family protein [Desulfobacterales bacterium]